MLFHFKMMLNEITNRQPSSVEVEEEEEVEIPVVPKEIIVEILSRLPVKSLCQFMCVSKQWLSLILDPSLAKTHLKQIITNDCLYSQRKKVLISSHKLYSLDYESIGRNDVNLVASEFYYPYKDKPNVLEFSDSAFDLFLLSDISEEDNDEFESSLWERTEQDSDTAWLDFVGSCNGLVCVCEDAFYVFNPSTRESKRIPDMPSAFSAKGWNIYVYGFGFDFANDDYKVVQLGCGKIKSNRNKVGCGSVCVYSLRTDSWRMVCSFPYHKNGYEPGVFLNGALHWMVRNGDGTDYKCVIAAFGLEEEVLSEMPGPNTPPSGQTLVGVLNGCLCVIQCDDQMRSDFWVMTEYGVGESWTKLTFSLTTGICIKLLCMAQNGEVLFLVDGNLLLHSFEDGNYRYLVDGIPKGNHFEAVTYLETLVSPNGFCRT